MLAGGGTYGHVYSVTWLDNQDGYWTMTPAYYVSNNYYMFRIGASGCIYIDVGNRKDIGIRPVINLKSSTTFLKGDFDGSASKPWTVEAS